MIFNDTKNVFSIDNCTNTPPSQISINLIDELDHLGIFFE